MVDLLRRADPAWKGNGFDAGSKVDRMAVDVISPAAQLSEMDADAEETGHAAHTGDLGKAFLNAERIAERIGCAVEEDQRSIAG